MRFERAELVRRYAISLASLLAMLLGWEVFARVGAYPAFILPGPQDVLARFAAYSATGRLWPHVAATLQEVFFGFSLAFSLACVLGYLIAHSRPLERAVLPVLVTAQALPIVAVAPLVILWFGFGITAKVLVCALISFFPMLISTVVGLRTIDPRLIEVGLIFGANRWQMLSMVEVPLALRVFLGGVRVGLPLSVTGAVVGEFVAADQGLGYLINLGRGLFDTPLMFVALFILATIALVLYEAVVLLEHVVTDDGQL
jgi:NitT/TauT family transport system permease protein